MISVTIFETDHQYRGFLCEGHAGYAQEGADIICAAVSALTFNTVNSLEAFTEDAFQVEQSEDGGYLKLVITETVSPEAELLLRSLVLGLQMTEQNYGSEFLTVRCQEQKEEVLFRND